MFAAFSESWTIRGNFSVYPWAQSLRGETKSSPPRTMGGWEANFVKYFPSWIFQAGKLAAPDFQGSGDNSSIQTQTILRRRTVNGSEILHQLMCTIFLEVLKIIPGGFSSCRISGSPSTVSFNPSSFVVPSFLGGPSWRNCLHLAGVKLTPFQASTCQSSSAAGFCTRRNRWPNGGTPRVMIWLFWFQSTYEIMKYPPPLMFLPPIPSSKFHLVANFNTKKKSDAVGEVMKAMKPSFFKFHKLIQSKWPLLSPNVGLVTNQPFKRVTFSLTIPKNHTKNRQAHQNDPEKKTITGVFEACVMLV